MPWVKLVHDCTMPRISHEQVGSVWECDQRGCGRHWEFAGWTPGEEPDWQRADWWTQTEHEEVDR
jgi:hypothetical protein